VTALWVAEVVEAEAVEAEAVEAEAVEAEAEVAPHLFVMMQLWTVAALEVEIPPSPRSVNLGVRQNAFRSYSKSRAPLSPVRPVFPVDLGCNTTVLDQRVVFALTFWSFSSINCGGNTA